MPILNRRSSVLVALGLIGVIGCAKDSGKSLLDGNSHSLPIPLHASDVDWPHGGQFEAYIEINFSSSWALDIGQTGGAYSYGDGSPRQAFGPGVFNYYNVRELLLRAVPAIDSSSDQKIACSVTFFDKPVQYVPAHGLEKIGTAVKLFNIAHTAQSSAEIDECLKNHPLEK